MCCFYLYRSVYLVTKGINKICLDEDFSDIRLTAIVKKNNLTILSVCLPRNDVWSEVGF